MADEETFEYEGPFDAVEVRAGDPYEWYTATRGDRVTVTGTAVEQFRRAEGWTEVRSAPKRKTPAKRKSEDTK
jgi:hypothetical protein